MKIKVIKNAYYVNEDLSNYGCVDEETFNNSFSHLLCIGDVWESYNDEYGNFFTCIEGKWKDELSDGWWDYDHMKGYFEIIEE